MNRFPLNRPPTILILTLFLSAALVASAADGNRQASAGMVIATTGRIMTIDLQNRTFRVRGSDGQAISNLVDWTPKRTVPTPAITFPGGVSIHFPGRPAKSPARTNGSTPNLDEYTVVTTGQDIVQGRCRLHTPGGLHTG